jgi:hypothetical protein
VENGQGWKRRSGNPPVVQRAWTRAKSRDNREKLD